MIVQFDFLGGPKDGESVQENLTGNHFGAAAAYYYMTQGGAVGSALWCRTEYVIELIQILSDSALRDLRDHGSPVRGHIYRVGCCSDVASVLVITVHHVCAFPHEASIHRPIERRPQAVSPADAIPGFTSELQDESSLDGEQPS